MENFGYNRPLRAVCDDAVEISEAARAENDRRHHKAGLAEWTMKDGASGHGGNERWRRRRYFARRQNGMDAIGVDMDNLGR